MTDGPLAVTNQIELEITNVDQSLRREIIQTKKSGKIHGNKVEKQQVTMKQSCERNSTS